MAEIIEFGFFPQSLVTDLKLIEALDEEAKNVTSSDKDQTEVTYNGEKYLRENRVYNSMKDKAETFLKKFYNFSFVTSVWFKIESVKWEVLEKSQEETLVVSKNILYYYPFSDDFSEEGYYNKELPYFFEHYQHLPCHWGGCGSGCLASFALLEKVEKKLCENKKDIAKKVIDYSGCYCDGEKEEYGYEVEYSYCAYADDKTLYAGQQKNHRQRLFFLSIDEVEKHKEKFSLAKMPTDYARFYYFVFYCEDDDNISCNYWLRSVYADSYCDVYSVNKNGDYEITKTDTTHGFAPAMYLRNNRSSKEQKIYSSPLPFDGFYYENSKPNKMDAYKLGKMVKFHFKQGKLYEYFEDSMYWRVFDCDILELGDGKWQIEVGNYTFTYNEKRPNSITLKKVCLSFSEKSFKYFTKTYKKMNAKKQVVVRLIPASLKQPILSIKKEPYKEEFEECELKKHKLECYNLEKKEINSKTHIGSPYYISGYDMFDSHTFEDLEKTYRATLEKCFVIDKGSVLNNKAVAIRLKDVLVNIPLALEENETIDENTTFNFIDLKYFSYNAIHGGFTNNEKRNISLQLVPIDYVKTNKLIIDNEEREITYKILNAEGDLIPLEITIDGVTYQAEFDCSKLPEEKKTTFRTTLDVIRIHSGPYVGEYIHPGYLDEDKKNKK